MVYLFIYLLVITARQVSLFYPSAPHFPQRCQTIILPVLRTSHIPPWRISPAYPSRMGCRVMWLCSANRSISSSRLSTWPKSRGSHFLLGTWKRDRDWVILPVRSQTARSCPVGLLQRARSSGSSEPGEAEKPRVSKVSIQRNRHKEGSDKPQGQTGKSCTWVKSGKRSRRNLWDFYPAPRGSAAASSPLGHCHN